jgi:acetyl-CoA carboxylase carboxyl transferase subunit beta
MEFNQEDFIPGSDTNKEEESSSWFKRVRKGILTSTSEKKDTPEGLWIKCPQCKHTATNQDLKEAFFVCPQCSYHHRIASADYFEIIFDDKQYTELFAQVKSVDFLGFSDLKPYKKRLVEAYDKTGLHDSISVAVGKVHGSDLVVCCMDFNFIGGSMGAVVGEKIARAVDHCIANRQALMIISKSGGARMMEAAFSLMQMAKSSAKLAQLGREKLPYISLMTDPTTGGVTASYAMLGDFNISEPGAMIGFAGPRVIKETIKRDLPKGFQTAEMVQETGFLDFIVHRKELKTKIAHILRMLM